MEIEKNKSIEDEVDDFLESHIEQGELITLETFINKVLELINENNIDDIEGGNNLYRFKIDSTWYEIYRSAGIYGLEIYLYKGKYIFATNIPLQTTIKIEYPTQQQLNMTDYLFGKLYMILKNK